MLKLKCRFTKDEDNSYLRPDKTTSAGGLAFLLPIFDDPDKTYNNIIAQDNTFNIHF